MYIYIPCSTSLDSGYPLYTCHNYDSYMYTQAMRQYIPLYGKPDYILYRTELWDLSAYVDECKVLNSGKDEEKEVYNITYKTHEFIRNHVWAISLIHSLVPTAYIGAYTVPNIKWGMHLFHYYTNSMRYISHKYGTFLYDWNLLLISHNKDVYLKDGHHPARPYSASFTGMH